MTPLYQKYDALQISESMLQEASKFFSDNYGVWSKEVKDKMIFPGARVKMSTARFRDMLLPPNAPCSYVRATADGVLLGHAFACRWKFNDMTVCWITQLTVHRDHRERGLATSMLKELKEDSDDLYGVASSHPATCLATARMSGTSVLDIDLGFIKSHAKAILELAPIAYLKNAELSGNLFCQENNSRGVVSSLNTGFFVDHEEPLMALARVRGTMTWPLGELIEGHKFVLILPVKRSAEALEVAHKS